MEREKSPLSRRARELISKAFIVGVDPIHLRAGVRKAIEDVQLKGRERVTRADLGGLRQEVQSIMDARGLGFKPAELVKPVDSICPWNPDEFWNM